jgi:hypothetical protein
MGLTEPIQRSLFVLVVGAGVEFGGNPVRVRTRKSLEDTAGVISANSPLG